MAQKNFFINKGAILVALCMISMIGNAVASEVTLYVGGGGDIYVDYGTPWVIIPINANVTGDSLGSMTLDVSVINISILIPSSTNFVLSGNCSMDAGTLDPQNETNGRSEFGITCMDVSGDFTMVRLNYTINSSICGKKSYIHLTPYGNVWDYSGMNTIPYIIKNGSVTIRCNNNCCPSGTTCNNNTGLCQPITITCYADADNDGYTNNANTTTSDTGACPTGYKNTSTVQDCNDANGSINPGATEISGNGIDENCNGHDSITCYADADNDNYTNNTNTTTSDTGTCPTGYKNTSTTQSDCNDANGSIKPGATEIPNNGIDENCDGSDNIVCYGDADNDGYGNATNTTTTNTTTCPSGYVNNSDDCNDNSNTTYPGATDIPNNGIDENCNGHDNITCYADLDNDTYTNNTNTVYSDTGTCPANYKSSNTTQDCNDNNSAINPETKWYVDNDNDSYGNTTNYTTSCTKPTTGNWTLIPGDCDDNNNQTLGAKTWYGDKDNDTYGNPANHTTSCTKPSGYWVLNSQDCNDNNASINPSVTYDIPNNGIDENCNGYDNMTYYRDADSDGYGNATNNQTSDVPISGYVTNVSMANDCNDNNTNISPGASEVYYDGIDNDCNGIIDACNQDSDCGGSNYKCIDHKCYKKKSTGGYTGVIDLTPPQPPTPPKEFNVSIPNEIIGTTTTLNLGPSASGATVTATIGNKTSTSKADAKGDVTITFPGYGEGEIKVSKSGYNDLVKTITVYAGALNITKISGEKYGDEFKFKVTDNNGNPVKDANVEVYGETLKTDASGIVRITIKTIQSGLEASASLKDYKGSSILFNVNPIGTLKVKVPEKVTKGDTITITVTDEKNNPVPNAKVTINGVEYAADENGKVEYKVTTTSLILKANKEGYVPSEQMSVSVKEKVECGNGKCEAGETKENCPQDCIICGDNVCDKGETYENCPNDCPKPSDNTGLIIAVILIIIILIIAAYYLMRKKKGGKEESK